MKTPTATATAIPRKGSCGITRSKLEVDECITVALRENDGAGHQEPDTGDHPARQTYHCAFERDVAQSPMGREQRYGDDRHLQNFAGAEDRIAVRMATKHSGDHAAGDLEV